MCMQSEYCDMCACMDICSKDVLPYKSLVVYEVLILCAMSVLNSTVIIRIVLQILNCNHFDI